MKRAASVLDLLYTLVFLLVCAPLFALVALVLAIAIALTAPAVWLAKQAQRGRPR